MNPDGVFDNLYVNNINIAGTQTGGGGGAPSFPLLAPNGTAGAPSYSFSATPTTGMFKSGPNALDFSIQGTDLFTFATSGRFFISADAAQIIAGAGADAILARDAPNIWAQVNSTNPQVFRIYQTFTNVTTYSRLEVGYSGFWSQYAIDVVESPSLFTGLFLHSPGSITARGETGVTLQTIGAGNDITMSPQANTWRFASSGGAQAGALVPIADGARNIGTTALRVGSIFVLNQLVSYSQIINQGTFATGVGVQLNFGGSYLYSASGVPSNAQGVNGDFYFRTDTPGTANQRIYVRSAGTWVGIV